jgi:hypothetical protein
MAPLEQKERRKTVNEVNKLNFKKEIFEEDPLFSIETTPVIKPSNNNTITIEQVENDLSPLLYDPIFTPRTVPNMNITNKINKSEKKQKEMEKDRSKLLKIEENLKENYEKKIELLSEIHQGEINTMKMKYEKIIKEKKNEEEGTMGIRLKSIDIELNERRKNYEEEFNEKKKVFDEELQERLLNFEREMKEKKKMMREEGFEKKSEVFKEEDIFSDQINDEYDEEDDDRFTEEETTNSLMESKMDIMDCIRDVKQKIIIFDYKLKDKGLLESEIIEVLNILSNFLFKNKKFDLNDYKGIYGIFKKKGDIKENINKLMEIFIENINNYEKEINKQIPNELINIKKSDNLLENENIIFLLNDLIIPYSSIIQNKINRVSRIINNDTLKNEIKKYDDSVNKENETIIENIEKDDKSVILQDLRNSSLLRIYKDDFKSNSFQNNELLIF